MSARDAFGVVVRSVGFGCVVAGLLNAVNFVLAVLALPTGYSTVQYPISVTATAAIVWTFVGLAILGCARWIVRIAYGHEDN